MATLTNGESMSSAAGSLAKTSATPESVPGLKANGPACGGNTRGSFAYFDLDTSSWRTYQGCLLPSHPDDRPPLDAFLGSWPASGTTRNGKAFRRRRLVPRKKGSASSSSPTMHAQDHKNCTFPPSQRGRNSIIGYLMRTTPTLRATELDSGRYQRDGGQKGRERATLLGLLTGWTPTLTASSSERGGRGELLHFVKSGTRRGKITPSLNAASGDKGPRKAATKAENGGHQVNLIDVTAHLSGRGGGVLNPRWCEWYMGFPEGWCDLPSEDLETLSSHK